MHTNKTNLLLVIVVFILNGCGNGSDITKTGNLPNGVSADTHGNITIIALGNTVGRERDELIKSIQLAPENYSPPVFYVLSELLFEDGKKEDACFWFYAGQLRARFDANRCADVSARQVVEVLNQHFGSSINKFAFRDVRKLETLIEKVVTWDKKTAHKYDHRWVNLHGINNTLKKLNKNDASLEDASLPRTQWKRIGEDTRSYYVESFSRAISPTGLGKPAEFFSDPEIASLVAAAEVGDVSKIDKMVSSGVEIDKPGKNGLTPLLWALLAKNKKGFERLLDDGADPNKQTTSGVNGVPTGSSAISLAAGIEGSSDWLKAVLQHGGDPNLANATDNISRGKTTPIFNAIKSQSKVNIELLIEAGADIDHQNEIGKTPMLYAAQLNRFDIVYDFLKAGADFQTKTTGGHDLMQEVLISKPNPSMQQWKRKVLEFLDKRMN